MNIIVIAHYWLKSASGFYSLFSRGWLAIFLALLLGNTVDSDAQEWNWIQRSGGSASDTGNDILVDRNGHVYTAGAFEGTTRIGTQSLTVAGNQDGFIAQWNVSGQLSWVIPAGGTDNDSVASLAADSHGNLIALGSTKSVEFTCGGLVVSNKWARDNESLFLTKLNASGKAGWIQLIGGAGINQMAAVATDAKDNIYVVGWMARFASFATTNLNGYEEALIAKFDPDGNLLWAKSAGGNGYDYGQSLAVTSDGYAYVSGYFEKTASFDSLKVTSRGGNDGFLAKYDPDGNALWVTGIGGSSYYDNAGRLALDPDGGVYLTGSFGGTATFGTNSLTTVGGAYNVEIYFARFNGSGENLWAQGIGLSGAESPGSVFVNLTTNGGIFSTNIYLTGKFLQTTRIGSVQLTNTVAQRTFVSRWDPAGNVVWVRQCGGDSSALALDQNPDPTVYLLANFTDPSAWREAFFTSRGNSDIVLAQLLPAQPEASGIPPVIQPLPATLEVAAYGPLLLEANVSTRMPATFQWRKNGTTLYDANRISGARTSRLTIQLVQTNDAGRYDLVVNNAYGAATSAVCQVTVNAQSAAGAPRWEWVRTVGGVRSDSVTRIATDSKGMTTVLGQFEGTNTIGQTVLVAPPNNRTLFLAQYDASGLPQWAVQSVGTKTETPTGLAIDDSGNHYVVGYFNSSSLTFNTTVLTNPASSYNEVFVAKYSAQGALQWAKAFGGERDDYARAVTVDGEGNIVVIGDFTSDNMAWDDIVITNLGGGDVFTTKLNPQGEVLWVRTAGDSGLHEGYAIAVDKASNIYVAGRIWSQIQFGTNKFDSHFDMDTFLASYDAQGAVRWARQFGNFSVALPRAIAVDSQQRVLMTGYFDQSFVLDGHPLICRGSQDTFVAQFDPEGKALWVQVLGGPGGDTPKDLVVDSEDRVCVIGSFAQTAAFGDINLAAGTQRNTYLAVLDSAGQLLWVKQTGGNRSADGNTLALGSDGALVLAGSFSTSINFDGADYQAMETSMDGFIAKLTPVSQVVTVSLRMLTAQAIEISGGTGKTITVQSTPALGAAASWVDRTNWVPASSPVIWTNPNPAAASAQFYRVRVEP